MTIVTDHAVVRWLERVEGVDIAAIRLEIERRAQRCEAAARVAGINDHYAIKSGRVTLILHGQTVVTVKTREMGVTILKPEA